MFLVQRIPAWGTTLSSRVTRHPKIHLVDSGMTAWLLGVTEEKIAKGDPAVLSEYGHLVETFAVGEILKQVSWWDGPVSAGHFRTGTGAEVDLVLCASLPHGSQGLLGCHGPSLLLLVGQSTARQSTLGIQVFTDSLGAVTSVQVTVRWRSDPQLLHAGGRWEWCSLDRDTFSAIAHLCSDQEQLRFPASVAAQRKLIESAGHAEDAQGVLP